MKLDVNKIVCIAPDLVVVDIELMSDNDKTGLKIANLIKVSNKLSKLPVAILSFYSEKEISKECKYDLFMSKPCNIETMIEKIYELLEKI